MKKLLEKFLALSKKTRIISIVLAAVVLCGAVTGIAIGVSKCGGSNQGGNSSTPTSSIEESSSEEENSIPAFGAVVNGEPCKITIGADDEYATVFCKIFVDVNISWTGDATVTLGGKEIANGSMIENQEAGVEFKVIPTAAGQVTEVVMTITEAEKEAAKELVIGANNVEFKGESVAYTFTATEAGTYILSLAEGEENAAVSCEYLKLLFNNGEPVLDGEGNQMSNIITEPCEVFPYEITLAEGETITFYVSAKDTESTEDTINLLWNKKL